jgi:hypothetical protein
MLVLRAMEEPGVVCLYVRRTLGLAKSTMWLQEPRDGIPTVLQELGLVEDEHYTLNLSTTEVRFANGSIVRLCGYERSNWSDVRGHKFVLLVLDEMQEQEDDGLTQALHADIPYCFMRHAGRFVGIGTPGAVAAGPFHDICEDVDGRRAGWVVHRWTARALRLKTPVWDGMLAWKAQHNIPDSYPRWRRDGLGEWAADGTELMLDVPPEGLWDGVTVPLRVPSIVPTVLVPRTQPLHVAAGLDFGFTTDPNAVVVGSTSREEGVLRTLYSESRGGLLNDELAAWLTDVMRAHGVRVFYADHARPDTIAELVRKYGLPVVGCDKGAYDFRLIEMRTMLRCGRLLIEQGSELHEELRTLAPDPTMLRKRMYRPRPGMKDHCFDALRYLFNGVHTNYLLRPEPPMSPAQREVEEARLHKERALSRHERPGVTRRTIG